MDEQAYLKFAFDQPLFNRATVLVKLQSEANAGPRSAVGSVSDSRARGTGFNTWSGHKLSFLLPLIQEGRLSATGESMCTKYWLTALQQIFYHRFVKPTDRIE